MATPQSTKATDASLARELLHATRYYLAGRRGVLVLAIVALLAVVGFSRSWLVAAGIAPVLLSALPCLVMCGAGLCMNKMIGGSCESRPSQSQEVKPTEGSPISDSAIVRLEGPSSDSSARRESVAADVISESPQAHQSDERSGSHA